MKYLILCLCLGACVTKPAKLLIENSGNQSHLKSKFNEAPDRDAQLKLLMEYVAQHEHEIMKLQIKSMLSEGQNALTKGE